jgi:hypothetical protein
MPNQRVLINSLPKSGTHLLAQAVALLGYREHFDIAAAPTPPFLNYREARDALERETVAEPDAPTVAVGALASWPVPLPSLRRWLEAMPRGGYLLGHLPWNPLLPELLAELDCRSLFILRDPRAVAVSLLAFVLNPGTMPQRHFLEADLRALPEARRLDFLLEGGPAPLAGMRIPPFAEWCRALMGWRTAPGCLCLRYEDLVGKAGGGTAEAQGRALERLAGHLGLEPGQAPLARGAEIYNPAARTFRSSSIDGWRRQLDAAARERLETACAGLCGELGYE